MIQTPIIPPIIQYSFFVEEARLQTPHVPPSLQCLQYAQVEQARQFVEPVHLPALTLTDIINIIISNKISLFISEYIYRVLSQAI